MSGTAIEPSPDAAAYESLKDELAALAPEEVMRVNVDLGRAGSRAIHVARYVQPLLPEIERHLPLLPHERLRKLDTYGLAAMHVGACAWRIPRRSVTKEVAAEAKRLRDRLLQAADCFVTLGYLDAGWIAHIRRGQGRLDMLQDMIALAHLFHREWPRIGKNTFVSAQDVEQAGMLGQRLLDAMAHGQNEIRDKRAEVADQCARMFTLLWRAYDVAQQAIVHLRWKERDAYYIAPSLCDNGGGPRKTKRTTEERADTAVISSSDHANGSAPNAPNA